jgi:hypothetical protein
MWRKPDLDFSEDGFAHSRRSHFFELKSQYLLKAIWGDEDWRSLWLTAISALVHSKALGSRRGRICSSPAERGKKGGTSDPKSRWWYPKRFWFVSPLLDPWSERQPIEFYIFILKYHISLLTAKQKKTCWSCVNEMENDVRLPEAQLVNPVVRTLCLLP